MKYIYVKLTKEWGGFQVDDVVRFGLPKGERIIEQGMGVKVKKQVAVNDLPPEPKTEPPKVETTDQPNVSEKAVVTPKITPKKEILPKEKKKDDEKGGAD